MFSTLLLGFQILALPKGGVLGQKVYPPQILSKILQDSSLVVLKKNHQRGKKSSTWGNFDFQKSFYSLFHVSTRADFTKRNSRSV